MGILITDQLTQLSTESEVLNEVAKNPGIIRKYLQDLTPSLLGFLIQLMIAVIILLVGSRMIKMLVKMVRRFLERGKVEAGVVSFLSSFVKYALYFVLAMIILGQFGVTTSSVIAVLGSAGLTMGLALQGSLSNFAGGVLILLLKPFVVGDYILDNASSEEGTVKEITIFYTKLLTIDNKLILIPNGSLSNSSITNYSHMDMRRIDLTVGVGYASDLSKVKAVLEGVVKTETAVIKDEPVDIFVSDLGDSAVDMGIRVWVKTEDYWPVRWRLLEQMKNALDENGISIPFPQIEVRKIADIESMGYILRHKKSGARVCVISNEDDNKVFSIGFRTPPEDETGVPHIIEHTTLCGSDKFPVKDPFIELAKGSLNTFLNAMTYPEKTLYPVASYNERDFKNLMEVYLDAVFHPNITKYKEIFMQEGWHYELESEDAPLTINGVVYNEMKGAYSSPDEVLETAIMESLFPDNTYSKNSGGNPEKIPELTYENYLAFYHKYYHPCNSYIYLYGDMDIEERLTWLDEEYLSHYDANEVEVHSQIQLQKPFDAVVSERRTYPITEDEPEEKHTYLSYNKVVGTVLDRELYQAFSILDYVLVSAPGAPVRQALIDAGIGEDVYGSFEDGMLQPMFSIVAKNADESDQTRFVQIIEETLQKLVKEGLNQDSLLAGINSAEFRFREADYGQFPKGLLYGLQCMDQTSAGISGRTVKGRRSVENSDAWQRGYEKRSHAVFQ